MTTHYQKIQALGNKMVSNLESMGVSANFNDGGMTLADKILEIQHFNNGLKLYADKNIGQIGDEINLYALVLKDNIAQSGKTILFKGLVNSTGTTKTFNANSTNIIGDKYEITSFPDLSNGSKVYLDKDHKIWLVHMGGGYGTVLQFLSQTETGTNVTGTLRKIVVENNTLTYWVGSRSATIDFKNGGYDRDLSVITTENNTLTITDYSVYGVTGNNGIANVTYTCSGVGDKNIQAIYQSSNDTLQSETYGVWDCLFFDNGGQNVDKWDTSRASGLVITYPNNEYTQIANTNVISSNSNYLCSPINLTGDWEAILECNLPVYAGNVGEYFGLRNFSLGKQTIWRATQTGWRYYKLRRVNGEYIGFVKVNESDEWQTINSQYNQLTNNENAQFCFTIYNPTETEHSIQFKNLKIYRI